MDGRTQCRRRAARLHDLCRRYGVERLEVFGSVARGDAEDGSDVDLLYELAPEATLGWEIEDLQDELGPLLGRPVDLVSKRALHRGLRPAVLVEACELFPMPTPAARAALELLRTRVRRPDPDQT